jgi:hypothetical protein
VDVSCQGYLIAGALGSQEFRRTLVLIPAYFAEKVRKAIALVSLRPIREGRQEIGPKALGGNFEITFTNHPCGNTVWLVQREDGLQADPDEVLNRTLLCNLYGGRTPVIQAYLPQRLTGLGTTPLPTKFRRSYFSS